MKKILSMLVMVTLSLVCAIAQDIKVTGTVVSDSDNEPMTGVSVMAEGMKVGTATDIDGNFTLTVPANAMLKFSYVGYKTQTVALNGRTNIEVRMVDNSELLDEVVVVGYGVQKKSVVTAAISKIDDSELAMTAPVRMDNALKGLASGVQVTSASGQPGEAARVRVRGIGTINNSDPLYIVDGMPIEGGLDYLNPNDIASIEVLKDAASGAVYGARAANGVILVTTKTGKIGKTQVNYDFSYGWQSAWRKRNVLNASEYAVMMNEGRLNAGMAPVYANPYEYGEGTDWQDEVFYDNAPMMSHQASISGATEKVNYLLSFGYYTQDGIVGGNYGRSNYERLTLRSNTTYTLFDSTKERSYLNLFKITANISYARVKSTGITTNSTWGSPLGSALALSPILTVFEPDPQSQLDYYAGNSNYVPMYDNDGNLYTIPGADYNEMVNPLASLSLPGSKGWSHKFVANFIGELQIYDGLKYRISYGADLSFWGSNSHRIPYYLRAADHWGGKTSAYASSDRGTVWQLENVLSYNKKIGAHDFTILLGQSAKESRGYYLNASKLYLNNLDKPYISNTDAQEHFDENGNLIVPATAAAGPNAKATLASLFGRLSYNFDERYMFEFTIRRDGSSRFGAHNRYATFPSVSGGWNFTNEKFLANRPEWFTFGKLRASWGKNGNENFENFRYTVLTSSANNYIFGNGENLAGGVKSSGLPNPDLKWEESIQTDLGLDLTFFNSSLRFSVDYYNKRTNGMLMVMNIPTYVGESKPWGNVGKMENSGVEFDLSYRRNFGDFNFSVSGNLSYLHNKLIEYGNESGWDNLDSFQGTGTITRAQNGLPFPYFYGYKTDGIYQNAAEAAAATTIGSGYKPKPGDVRFRDISGPEGTPDGVIDDYDRTMIGKGTPDWTYGISLTASWRGLDFSMMWQGTWGNDVFDATRRNDIAATNLPSWMLNRWTGEGTSNKYPRFVIGDSYNWQSSDLLVYDGSYCRLKNLQIGYTLPERITKKAFIQKLRVYVAGENLWTITKYHGFDPEISSGGTSLGIDYGVYPQARVYTVGFNLQF